MSSSRSRSRRPSAKPTNWCNSPVVGNLCCRSGYVERFNPAFVSVQDRLQEPNIIEARRRAASSLARPTSALIMDLMIHDIDAVLSLKIAVTSVDAAGISVLGDHEDMVSARLHFANGRRGQPDRLAHQLAPRGRCRFTRRRVLRRSTSRRAKRPWSNRGSTCCSVISMNELNDETRNHLREQLFNELLVKSEVPAVESNAIEQEQRDFAEAHSHWPRTSRHRRRWPRCGRRGRDGA